MTQNRQDSSNGADPRAAVAGPVMIVDDDVSCLTAIEQIVAVWGHETVSFTSFEEARAYLATARPAVAIVDVRLGNYNGLQLVHLTQQKSPDTRLFVVSGFDDPVLRAEATRLGAVYLTKPLDLARLRDHLSAAFT